MPVSGRGVRIGVAAALFALLGSACRQPGVKATGQGRVEWTADSTWLGPCSYTLSTRWATSLPHVVRIDNDRSEDALVLSRRNAWRPGRSLLPLDDGQSAQGLALDGGTVRGSIHGTVDVARVDDSTVIVVEGERRHRDTARFVAECRLGPIAR